MSKLDDIVMDGLAASYGVGSDKSRSTALVDIYADRTAEELIELINSLLGESIRDTNNSDEAIAMFRDRVKEL